MRDPKLYLLDSEWLFVAAFLLLMGSLVAIVKINNYRFFSTEEFSLASHASCIVTIEGEVENPGTYHVLPGTKLKKILQKSRPTASANLRQIDPSFRIEETSHFHIEALREILITVRGKPLILPIGTRVCDLKNHIEYTKEERSFFKSRRKLKDGEVIQ